MSNTEVIKLGNPLLRLVSKLIPDNEYGTNELRRLSEKLFNVMKVESGLGLAAPQIGINKRAIVFGMEQHPARTDLPPIPYTVLFNPSFEPITDETYADYEGCLSVGSLRAKVSRYKSIVYRGFDAEGSLIEREVSDLHARVIQHEIDHLDGVIFLDRVTDYHSMGFHDELTLAGTFNSREAD
tara:strand:- start:3029 stop:3577 length:549 start_codon:yes stop_codon:yes gene_type:complete